MKTYEIFGIFGLAGICFLMTAFLFLVISPVSMVVACLVMVIGLTATFAVAKGLIETVEDYRRRENG